MEDFLSDMNRKKIIVLTGAFGNLGKHILNGLNNENTVVYSLDICNSPDYDPDYQCLCDITDRKSVNEAILHISQKTGCIDAVIHCAGVHLKKKFTDVSENEILKMINVNIIGTINVMQAVIPFLKENENGGEIINISSSAAFDHLPGTSVYSMVKSAMNSLTQSLAKEYISSNIAVYAICPTVIYTENVDENIEKIVYKTNQNKDVVLKEYCEKLNPEKRLVSPDEIIGLIKFILNDKKHSMTGSLFPINCGSTMRP